MTEGEAKALIKEVNKKNSQILENMTKTLQKKSYKSHSCDPSMISIFGYLQIE